MIWCSITAATMELFTSVLGKTAQPKSSDYVGASCDLLSFLSNIFARRQYTHHEPLRTIHTHRVCEPIYLRVAFPLGKFTFYQTRHSRVTFQHSLVASPSPGSLHQRIQITSILLVCGSRAYGLRHLTNIRPLGVTSTRVPVGNQLIPSHQYVGSDYSL